MFHWKKLGQIFDPGMFGNQHYLKEFSQSPSALEFSDYVRVYFCARPARTPDGQYESHVAFVDLEKSNLTKILRISDHIVFPLGEYGTFDEFGTHPISVIRHEDEIRIYYCGISRCESVPYNTSLGVAISHDNGDTFTRIGKGPILSHSLDEPMIQGSPRIRHYNGKWYLWYIAGKEWVKTETRLEPVYKLRMAWSDNGIDWTKHGQDLLPDKLGIHECHASPDVTYHNGIYHMFFSYRGIHNYKSKTGGYQIGYARSTDLFHWHRNDVMAGITTSDSGWDADMVSYPHILRLNDKTYLFYQGNGMGQTGFGLAELTNPEIWGE